MTAAWILAAALVLDALVGEPDWLWRHVPHPAVLMGRVIGWSDKTLNNGTHRKAKGIFVVLGLILLGAILGTLVTALGTLVEIVVVAVLLAHRSLMQHVHAVADGLRMSTLQGRRAVAMIVSRDTRDMPPPAIARSAIESAAENFGDGVVAPAFWFLIGGLPGIIIYKLVNTADSMIGYRTDRYILFGWASARLDDVLNWIPARVTALLIALPAGITSQWRAIRHDAALHRSPNAGWPEAAMARAINVALAGPRAYDGVMQDFAWVNPEGARKIGPTEIDVCLTRLWQAWFVTLGGSMVLGLLSLLIG
ncbi:adenosylcobinamide-phosphate synthase CbiB [Sulfitobacter sp. F26204]|uniref:adenosylcobinamide-phosphate synthase CbiB n=1 Tax=Sulfitobacter sp. F26204 TaxID=2996014 RepID=UPI00225E4DFC|nr:adenosylcobinamide-phosphate synthase CbiB [Sulfitobacter sp. F26204]MCX7558629.1 adenosylcobinamide-phosphate synthase CbiB [Sulfitobacter sp. F26204]